jgi:hypothetical protein
LRSVVTTALASIASTWATLAGFLRSTSHTRSPTSATKSTLSRLGRIRCTCRRRLQLAEIPHIASRPILVVELRTANGACEVGQLSRKRIAVGGGAKHVVVRPHNRSEAAVLGEPVGGYALGVEIAALVAVGGARGVGYANNDCSQLLDEPGLRVREGRKLGAQNNADACAREHVQ